MISIPKHLAGIIQRAVQRAIPELTDPVAVTAEKNKAWEYVSPSAMKFYNMHKKKGAFGFANCQEMATAIVESIATEPAAADVIERVELAQAGQGDPAKSGFFMNIFLKPEFIQDEIRKVYTSESVRLQQTIDLEAQSQAAAGEEEKKEEGNEAEEEKKEAQQPAAPQKKRVLVDFSSPNIAKNMHVGHLRSTIQGDSICRIFEYLGYDVVRTNHVGDWGTQFGMLIAELDSRFPNFLEETPAIADLQTFYQNAKRRFDAEEDFKATAHANVVKLQSGDEHCTKAWQMLCQLSRGEFQTIYDRLDIRLTEVGESFYNPMLAPMVDELVESGVAVVNDGATCVFVPKQKVPLIIRKSDGGFGYGATDMAALRYRVQEQKAERVVYVTDKGQEHHFKLVFASGVKAGFYDPKVTALNHMQFGTVMQETEVVDEATGETKKKIEKMKTRSGDTVKLADLLDESKARALVQFQERIARQQANAAAADGEGEESKEGAQAQAAQKVQVDPAKLEEASEILGLSSIKYYDLKQNRINDYVFDFDRMLEPDGDTGVYLLYQYVRICSIISKSQFGSPEALEQIRQSEGFAITSPKERELALTILRLPEQLDMAVSDLQINRVCDLLYDIAVKVGQFYSAVRVMGSEEEASRILLLESVRKIMLVCFDLLGMKTIEKI